MAYKKTYTDCCWDFLYGKLPGQSMSFLPSFALGTLFSILALIYLYKRQTKKPLKIILIDILRRIFCLFPSVDHPDTQMCNSWSCIRCKKSREMIDVIIRRWEWHELPPSTPRLKEAIENLYPEESGDEDEEVSDLEDEDDKQLINAKKEKNKFLRQENDMKKSRKNSLQSPTIFYMNLTSNPCWDEYKIFEVERKLLKLNFSIIFEEFQKVYEAFQRNDLWGWKLNDIPKGHWCMFPLIDQGVVNESNCKRCINTSTMIQNLPSFMSDCVFGNAAFSILYPGSNIESHYGPTNIRLRAHLGE